MITNHRSREGVDYYKVGSRKVAQVDVMDFWVRMCGEKAVRDFLATCSMDEWGYVIAEPEETEEPQPQPPDNEGGAQTPLPFLLEECGPGGDARRAARILAEKAKVMPSAAASPGVVCEFCRWRADLRCAGQRGRMTPGDDCQSFQEREEEKKKEVQEHDT